MHHNRFHQKRGHHHHHERQLPDPIAGLSSIANQFASAIGLDPGSPSKPTPKSPTNPVAPSSQAQNPGAQQTQAQTQTQPAAAQQTQQQTQQQQNTPAQQTQQNGQAQAATTDDGSETTHNGPSTVFTTISFTGTGLFSLSTKTEAAPSIATRHTDSSSNSDGQTDTTLRTKSSTHHTHDRSSTGSAIAAATAAATTTASSIMNIASTSGPSAAATTSGGITSSGLAVSNQAVSAGLSSGAKAGIALGVILGVIAIVAAAFALWRMKQNRDIGSYEIQNSTEKNPFSDAAATNTSQPPPPIMASMMNPPPAAYSAPAAPATNPFGSGAVPVVPSSTSAAAPMVQTAGNAGTLGAGSGLGAATGIGAAVGIGAAALAGIAAANSKSNNAPPLNNNRAQSPALMAPPPVPASPVGSNFSESSTLTSGAMAAVGGAGAGTTNGPRMHRVQMDFNPTMEDELQIRAGEIVRVVREFDDGWCSVELVQRDAKGNLLRNQSGVVPRTCLSRLPLKPRQRRPSAPGSMPPTNGRMQSPALVPNQQRSMSPGPYGGGPQDRSQNPASRSRSNSAHDMGNRPRGPPIGLSPMNPASQQFNQPNLALQRSQDPNAIIAPLNPGHNRDGSDASFARKPVPRQNSA